MFVTELTKIKESEDKADQLQKKAKTDSRQALADTKAKAEKIIDDAHSNAKSTYDSLIEEGQKKSEAEYNLFLEKTKEKCKQMIDNAKNNENKAIELIAERIVR